LAALTAAAFWPAVRHFTTRPMVGGHDSSIFAWAWWNLGESIRHGRNPFHTHDLFFPVGVDLSVTVTAPAIAVVTWPVRMAFGPSAQVNAAELGAAFGAGAACYVLVLRFVRLRSIAALAGAAFAFTPYMYAHVGEHLNLIHTWLLPVAFLAVLRLVDEPSTRRMAVVGAVLGFAVLVEPQLAVITAVGVAVLAARRWEGARPTSRMLLALLGAGLFVAAPVAVPMAIGLVDGASSTPLTAHQLRWYSSRATAWFLPAPWNPVVGAVSRTGALEVPIEGVAGPGLVVLVLAYLGRGRRKAVERRGWVALAWTGAVLSLGPFLAIGNEPTDIPLPYFLVRLLPFMETMRAPGRFVILGVLALCVLAAQSAEVLLDGMGGPRRAFWLVAGTAVLGLELLPRPLPSIDGDAPAPYSAIADDPGRGAVLELPIQWLTGSDARGYDEANLTLFQEWATVHGKPEVNGSVSRYPDDALERLEAIPLYRQVRALQGDHRVHDPARFDARDLAEARIGYVVYHRDLPLPRARAYIEGLHLPVLADDGVVIVWRVPAI
jgi:hypothetical protein